MATAKKQDNVTRNLVIGMVVLVVAVGVIFGMVGSASKKNVKTPDSVDKSNGYAITFNKGLTGVPKLDIWEDFQCPVCDNFESVNGAQIQQWIAQKKVVAAYHMLSFIGPESALEANAGACAANENKFLQLHSVLYANQGKENSGIWTNASLIAAGSKAGITSSTFAECVSSVKYKDYVNNIAADGNTKNINATPTVFLNGKEITRNGQYFDAAQFAKTVLG